MKAGRLSVNAAGQIVAHVPKAEQADAVARVVAESQGKSRQSPARVISGVNPRARRKPSRCARCLRGTSVRKHP